MIIEFLAARRLTQLVTEDKITEPIREPILRWGERHEEGTWQDRVAYLVSCPACSSVWAAAGRKNTSVLTSAGFAQSACLTWRNHAMTGSRASATSALRPRKFLIVLSAITLTA